MALRFLTSQFSVCSKGTILPFGVPLAIREYTPNAFSSRKGMWKSLAMALPQGNLWQQQFGNHPSGFRQLAAWLKRHGIEAVHA